MTFIKINRDSIRKNPNAGRTRTYVQGRSTISFRIEGEVPKELNEGEDFYTTTWSTDFVEGVLINEEAVNTLRTLQNCTIEISREGYYLDHLPEADYLYEYENQVLVCENCHSEVPLNNVEDEYTYEGSHYLICPVCKGADTFGRLEYEEIKDAVKQLNEAN